MKRKILFYLYTYIFFSVGILLSAPYSSGDNYLVSGSGQSGFDITAAEGQTTNVIANGDITADFNGDCSMGNANNSGTVDLILRNSDNYIKFNNGFYFSNKGKSGSTSKITISGSNNTLEMGAFIAPVGDGTYSYLNVTGSNNVFWWTGNHRGYGDIRPYEASVSSGLMNFYFKGDGSATDKRVYFYAGGGDGLRIYGSTNNNSTFKTQIVLDGNVTFQKNPDSTNLNVSIMHDSNNASDYGQAEFIVQGANNEVNVNWFKIGNANMTSGNFGKLIIAGSGSNVYTSYLSLVGSDNLDVFNMTMDNLAGGVLQYNINSDSVSTLNVTNGGKPMQNFTGVIVLNLEDFIDAKVDTEYTYTLISANANWEGQYNDWYSSEKYLVNLNSNQEAEVSFEYLNNSLIANVVFTAVPEPNTYAIVFGLLALGFVVYRRRK